MSKPGFYDPAEHSGTWKASFSAGAQSPAKEVAIHVSVLDPTTCIAVAELDEMHSEELYACIPIEQVFTDIVDRLHQQDGLDA